jgi:hypothetical protein
VGNPTRQRTVMRWESGVFDFDAVEMESPAHEATVSEYPIERGSVITDHVRLKAVTLRMVVWLSNNPSSVNLAQINDTAARYGSVRQLAPRGMDDMTASDRHTIYVKQPKINTPPSAQLPTSVAGVPLVERVPVTAVVRTWEPSGQRVLRVQNVFAELLRSMKEARLFTVVSDLYGEYDQMLIRAIRTDRDARTGNAMRLDLDLAQVTFAELLRRNVSARMPKKPPKPKEQRSKPKEDEGKKTPVEADTKTKESVTTSHILDGLKWSELVR